MKTQRMSYLPPVVEIIEMENEGVMAASGTGSIGTGSLNKDTWPTTSSGTYRPYGGASSSDLEEMINDILTVKN